MSYSSSCSNTFPSSTSSSPLPIPSPPLSLPWSTSRRNFCDDVPTHSSRVWPQWEDTTSYLDFPVEEIDDIHHKADDDSVEEQGVVRRAKLWQSIYEHIDLRSQTNRVRLENMHDSFNRTCFMVDYTIRLRYYKTQSAIRRTKKNLSKVLRPTQ